MAEQNSNAPARSAPVEPQARSAQPQFDLTGRLFMHFSKPGPAGRRDIQTGVVEGYVGSGHWSLRFDSPAGFFFSNVVPTEQLAQLVFVTSREEQEAFLADLALSVPGPVAAKPSN